MKPRTQRAVVAVMPKSINRYKINTNSIRADIQDGLYSDIPEQNIVPFSGYCFELLSQVIFGNSHHNGGIFELEYDGPTFQPDLFNESGDLVETKSCYEGMQLKLLRKQIIGYANYTLKNPNKKIDFNFFSHGIEGMRRRKLSRKTYVDEFAKAVHFTIKTPFAVPLQFYLDSDCKEPDGTRLRLNEYGITNRGVNRGYASHSILSVSTTFLRKLLERPKGTLEALDLNPDDFNFERYMIEGIKVNRKKISPFPLLEIKLKDQETWFSKSRKSIEDLVQFSGESQVEIPKTNSESQIDMVQDKDGTYVQKIPEKEPWEEWGNEDDTENDEDDILF